MACTALRDATRIAYGWLPGLKWGQLELRRWSLYIFKRQSEGQIHGRVMDLSFIPLPERVRQGKCGMMIGTSQTPFQRFRPCRD